MAITPKGSVKIKVMMIIFGLVATFALVSYFVLLNTKNSSSAIRPKPHQATPLPKKLTLQNPKEYSDDNLSFFYPGDFELDTGSTSADLSWKAKLKDGSYQTDAISLKTQLTSFTEPINTENDPAFSVDDRQGRLINGVEVMEYTVHCSYHCSRRIDQFKINNTYYELSFDVFLPGFSEQAELILNTLKVDNPTPTPSKTEEKNKACTLEAKLCPDGSSVGRTGPNCEFSACPE